MTEKILEEEKQALDVILSEKNTFICLLKEVEEFVRRWGDGINQKAGSERLPEYDMTVFKISLRCEEQLALEKILNFWELEELSHQQDYFVYSLKKTIIPPTDILHPTNDLRLKHCHNLVKMIDDRTEAFLKSKPLDNTIPNE